MINPSFSSDKDNPDLPGGLLQHSEIITVVGHHLLFVTDSGVHLIWDHAPLSLCSRVNLAVQSTDAEVTWSARFSMFKIRVGGGRGQYCVGLQDGPVTSSTY